MSTKTKKSSIQVTKTVNNEDLKITGVQRFAKDVMYITTNETNDKGEFLTYIDTVGESGMRERANEEFPVK